MPAGAALPLAIGGIGSLIGGLGKSGKQGGQTQTQNQNEEFNTTESQNQSGKQTSSGLQELLESPYFSKFREDITKQLGGALKDAEKPVFGDREIASTMGNLNDLANASIKSLKGHASSRGLGDSGLQDQNLIDVELNRSNQATSFMNQIPMLNRQYKDQQIAGLLGLGSQFAGRAPLSQRTTGENFFDSTGSSTRSGTSKSSGTNKTEVQGPSWWKAMLQDFGGFAGDFAAGGGFNRPAGGGRYPNVQGLPNRTPRLSPWDFYGVGPRNGPSPGSMDDWG